MKPITALHTADFHYYRENKEKALLSLETVCKTGEEKAVDLFILSGDLFDRPVNDTESSGFPSLLNVMERMMNIAPVVAVTGTPTHDLPGCYEVFQKIKAKHRFTILKPSIPYFLASDEGRSIVSAEPWSEDDRLLILGCPEPSKTWFTRDKQLGKAESDEAINEGMRQLLLGLGAIRKEYATIPCIFVGHIEVANTPTCTGHIIQGGIKIGKDDLALVGADYYALGHIHLGQEVRERAYYCGSAFPIDWGETDQKHFNLVKLEDDSFYLRVINYPHPIRKKIVLDSWPDTEIVDSMVRGFQCRVQLRMSKEERSSINTDSVLNWLMESGAAPGSIVEVLVKPTETIRSEQITDTTSLLEKVKIYAELSNDSVSDSILEKADYVEGAARAEGLTSESRQRPGRD
jgi:DNA repair exonuclease SbcCD nuclease subunit